MPWDHLELDIALDVASYQDRVIKKELSDFLVVKLGANHSLVKRNRPKELLDQLMTITASRPAGPWTTSELVNGLGWGDSRGARVSVGTAMRELGWAVKHTALGYAKRTPNGRSRPTKLTGVYTK